MSNHEGEVQLGDKVNKFLIKRIDNNEIVIGELTAEEDLLLKQALRNTIFVLSPEELDRLTRRKVTRDPKIDIVDACLDVIRLTSRRQVRELWKNRPELQDLAEVKKSMEIGFMVLDGAIRNGADGKDPDLRPYLFKLPSEITIVGKEVYQECPAEAFSRVMAKRAIPVVQGIRSQLGE